MTRCLCLCLATVPGAAAAANDAGAGEPAPGDRWTERWRMRACDDFVEIAITFAVQPEGGIAIEAQ